MGFRVNAIELVITGKEITQDHCVRSGSLGIFARTRAGQSRMDAPATLPATTIVWVIAIRLATTQEGRAKFAHIVLCIRHPAAYIFWIP